MIQDKDNYYMAMALCKAEEAFAMGEVPVGAVAVCEGTVIASAHNRVEIDCDATAHAEILALRGAAAKLKRWRLSDVTIYVTLEPCAMCAGAMINSRVERLVYGAYDSRAGAVDSLFNIGQTKILGHCLEVRGGVLQDECLGILRQFFAMRRV